MIRFKVFFTKNIELTYNLLDEDIVNEWAELIKGFSPSDLCSNNHYIGYTSEAQVLNKIERLYELADYINQYATERVIKLKLSRDNWHENLHAMHIHFPELKNNIEYQHCWSHLSEYNDIIHWLESTLINVWGDNPSESKYFRITLDFNKSSSAKFYDIPDSAYKLFNPFSLFGDLNIHYTHVGKHPQELFIVNDLICPKNQLVPQRIYTGSVRMLFTDDFFKDTGDRQRFLDNWKDYYYIRGGKEFWGYEIDDPKLAFGYMKIGELSNIMLDGEAINIPKSSVDRHIFRDKLANTQVIGWEIIKGA